MPLAQQVSIHGIVDIGEWTALDDVAGVDTNEFHDTNVYTKTSWGLTAEEGARIVPSASTVQQRSGQSAAIVSSFINEANAQLELRLLDAQLQSLMRLMGVPDAALIGDLSTPEDEYLIVRGAELGSVERKLYVTTMGPLGPRTYYFPRCKNATFPEQAMSRTAFFEPNAQFDCYENDAGELYWIHDAAA